jgi:cobalamin biosynthesis Mg chelatase CobN
VYRDEDTGYSSGHWVRQLAEDVREIRRAQEKQSQDIGDLRVSVSKMEGRQGAMESTIEGLTRSVSALQREGRAESYIDTSALVQAAVIALAVLLALGAIWWIGQLP